MTAMGSHSYRFFLELHRVDAAGRHCGVLTTTRRLEHLPPPQPGIKEAFHRFWSNAIHGVEVKHLTCEPVGSQDFIVRATVSAEDSPSREMAPPERSAVHTHIRKGDIPPINIKPPDTATEYHIHLPPPQIQLPQQPPPIVNVNVENDPLDATVKFKRRSDGTLDSAQITENPETDG